MDEFDRIEEARERNEGLTYEEYHERAEALREGDTEEDEDDPILKEAIINIKQAIAQVAQVLQYEKSDTLAAAQADLEQAVRFLEGDEEPS